MSDSSVPLVSIEYGNSQVTHCRRQFIVYRDRNWICSRGTYYWQISVPIIASALGTFAALSSRESPFHVVIAIFLIGYTAHLLFQWKRYSRWIDETYFSARYTSDERKIVLKIAADGLREHQGDVTAFAPWKDVVSSEIKDDLLIIHLSSDQEAIIPRKSLNLPPVDLEAIQAEIEKRRR